TVPPTAGLVGKLFGPRYLGTLFGLTLLSHQVGGFFGAWLGGLALEHFGDYTWMWYADMVLALLATLVNLPIRESSPKLQAAAAQARRSARAARAEAVPFQRLCLRLEAERLGPLLELRDHVEVLELDRRMAAVADQERHRMLRRARMVAGDEGVDRFELVDEAVGEQEVERAVDRRWRGGAGTLAFDVVAGADLFEQVVGLDRLAGVGDQSEHARTDRRQPQAALVAGALDRVHEAFGVMDVVLGIW